MTEIIETSAEIKSSVNEKRFFQTMGHLFATSYSFLGELMQNARRAGASLIDFNFDENKKSLVLTDNGSGIEDFAVLIQFCESKWGEDVVLNDKPFGMGLYSLFFACSTVRVRSRGLVLVVTLDDVVESRSLKVLPDSEPVTTGTAIELLGLNEKLLGRDMLRQQCVDRAKGFPVPVQFNGELLPRPDAQENLQGENTEIGFLSLSGVRGDGKELTHHNARLYLQGLPIDGGVDRYATTNVIHLDSKSFTAVMPDRSVLFNKQEQCERIIGVMIQTMRAYLVRQQASLPGDEFVLRHWDDCVKLAVPHLLNGTPFIPGRIVHGIQGQSQCREDNFSRCYGDKVVITREQVATGQVKIWHDAPSTSGEEAEAAAFLRVMEALDIRVANVPVGHWLREITPRCADMFIERVTPVNEQGRIDAGDMCEAVLVDAVEIEIKSSTDADFSLIYREESEFIVVPADLSDLEDNFDAPGDTDTLCYFVPSCRAEPSTVFSDFVDEFDSYVESWHDEASRRWREAMDSLKGLSMAQITGSAIHELDCKLGVIQEGQLALVRAVKRWDDYRKVFRNPELNVIDLMSDSFWANVAGALCAGDSQLSPQAIRDAFFAAARPAEKLVYDPNVSLCLALGMKISQVEGVLTLQYAVKGENHMQQVSGAADGWDEAGKRVFEHVLQSCPEQAMDWDAMDFETKLALASKVFGLD